MKRIANQQQVSLDLSFCIFADWMGGCGKSFRKRLISRLDVNANGDWSGCGRHLATKDANASCRVAGIR